VASLLKERQAVLPIVPANAESVSLNFLADSGQVCAFGNSSNDVDLAREPMVESRERQQVQPVAANRWKGWRSRRTDTCEREFHLQ